MLAQWLTSANNPYFAKAMVNRFWHRFFGRGLVNPVDDMHEDNAATHPELLNTLTEQFKKSNFDVKYLLRAICNSETYQRTSRPTEGNGDDTVAYSHRRVRMLAPKPLFDSIVAAVGKVEPGKQPAPSRRKVRPLPIGTALSISSAPMTWLTLLNTSMVFLKFCG